MKKVAQIQILSNAAMMAQIELMSKHHKSQHNAHKHNSEAVIIEHFSFESLHALFSELSLSCWRLLEYLQQNPNANTLDELAKQLEYSPTHIIRDIKKLLILGLLEKSEDGKAYVPFDDIQLSFRLSVEKGRLP